MTYRTQSIEGFLSAVASERVAPAGGSVSAIVGAAGAALCEMVCIHTVNRKGVESARELAEIGDGLRHRRDGLLALADGDAAAMEALLGLEGDDPGLREAKRATGVPLAVAEGCLEVVEVAIVVAERGNPNAAPDAVTGALLADAALRASTETVRSNLDGVDDEAFVGEIRRRAAAAERDAESAIDRLPDAGQRQS